MRLRSILITLACLWTIAGAAVTAAGEFSAAPAGGLASLPAANSGVKLDGDEIAFEINVNRTPAFVYWDATVTSVGWYYTPSASYNLSRVETHFRRDLGAVCSAIGYDRTVTIEILTDRPAVDGTLLGSCQFDSQNARGRLGGCNLTEPVPLEAGVRYFIGFRNMQYLGVQATMDAGAEQLCPGDGGYLDRDALGNYNIGPMATCKQRSWINQPILRLFKAAQ